jgi:elongation factor P
MISTGDLKKGVTIEIDGVPHTIIEWQHVKIGRGGAIVRIKFKNLKTGAIFDRTYDAGERFPRAYLDRRTVVYQYNDGDQYYFMDTDNFETVQLSAEQLGDARYYLLDGMKLDVISYKDEPLDVELPTTVDLKVTYTEPGFKGDTATGGTKPAELETGLTVQVPLFVTNGETIRVKTDTGTYVERVG